MSKKKSQNELHQNFLTEFALMKVDRIPHFSFPAKDVVSYRGDGELQTTIKSTELDALVDKIANKEDLDDPDKYVHEANTGDHMLNDILNEADDYQDEELFESYIKSLMEKADDDDEEEIDDDDDDDKSDDDDDDDDDDDEAGVNKLIDEYDKKDSDKEDYFSESYRYEDVNDYDISDKAILEDKDNWDSPRKREYDVPLTESFDNKSNAPISYLEENDASINKLLSELDQLDEGLDSIESVNSDVASRLVFEEADPDFNIIDDGTEDEDIISDVDLDDDDDLELDIEEELIDADTELDDDEYDEEDSPFDDEIDLDEDEDIYSDDEF